MCGINAAVSPAANIVPVLREGLRKLDYQKKEENEEENGV